MQVFVFDFGSEMYVWTGKHVPFDRRKRALRLALELWDAGYDYSRHDINPLCPLICTISLFVLSYTVASSTVRKPLAGSGVERVDLLRLLAVS